MCNSCRVSVLLSGGRSQLLSLFVEGRVVPWEFANHDHLRISLVDDQTFAVLELPNQK